MVISIDFPALEVDRTYTLGHTVRTYGSTRQNQSSQLIGGVFRRLNEVTNAMWKKRMNVSSAGAHEQQSVGIF